MQFQTHPKRFKTKIERGFESSDFFYLLDSSLLILKFLKKSFLLVAAACQQQLCTEVDLFCCQNLGRYLSEPNSNVSHHCMPPQNDRITIL